MFVVWMFDVDIRRMDDRYIFDRCSIDFRRVHIPEIFNTYPIGSVGWISINVRSFSSDGSLIDR